VVKSGDNFKTIGVINVFSKNSNTEAEFKCRNYDFNIKIHEIPIAEEGIDEELNNFVNHCM
jgi:hypothetical protein